MGLAEVQSRCGDNQTPASTGGWGEETLFWRFSLPSLPEQRSVGKSDHFFRTTFEARNFF